MGRIQRLIFGPVGNDIEQLMTGVDIESATTGQHGINLSAALLEVISLTKRYSEQLALNHVSFAVQAGEVLGLIGPNGAGKTTLLEAIAGLLPVDAGSILWRGRPLRAEQRRNAVFYLPDGIRPYGDQFVEQVLAFFANIYRRPEPDVSNVVAAVGFRPVLTKRVHSLSKGYNRRLIIAIGLLTPHPMLLMDEPFDGFDLRQTRDMMTALRRVASDGRTLLRSTEHGLTLAILADSKPPTKATLRMRRSLAKSNPVFGTAGRRFKT
jgi:ABC-2 type transport system ATP-binding protein